MTIPEAHAEVKHGWAKSYSPEAIASAVASIAHKPLGYRVNILIARLCFRGIYFPQMGRFAWAKTFAQNRRTIYALIKEALNANGRRHSRRESDRPALQVQ
jgi:cytochrome b